MDFAKVEFFGSSLEDKVKNIAKSILEKIESDSLLEIASDRAIVLKENDILRVLSKMNVDENQRILWEMTAREAYKAEQSAAFSSYLFLNEISGVTSQEVFSRKMNSLDLQEISEKLLGKSLGGSLVDSLKAAGPNAILEVEEIDGQTFIRTEDCVEVSTSIPGEFGEKLELRDVNFFTFDGIIERVSEINRLLEEVSQRDETAIILARGFGYEVISTLLHNWRLKKLKIIPASVSGNPMDNFLFIDLPEIVGGNRIMIDDIWKERPELIEMIEIEKGKIIIRDSKISKNANLYSKKIIEESSSNPSAREWAAIRARKISSRKITVYLGKEYGELKGIVKDRLQSLIRFILFSRKDGISLVKTRKNDIIIPSKSFAEAKRSAASFMDVMKNTKVIIKNDK